MNELKTCGRCATLKPLGVFVKDKRNATGYGSWCRACAKSYRVENRERLLAYFKTYRQENLVKCKAKEERWKRTNAQRVRNNANAWYAKNADRVRPKKNEASRQWFREHKEVSALHSAGRRAAKLQATPPWADLAAIRNFYRRARELTAASGMPWHVDHVVPLKHPLVCGLHCEANLEVRVGVLNIKKNNRFEVGAPL